LRSPMKFGETKLLLSVLGVTKDRQQLLNAAHIHHTLSNAQQGLCTHATGKSAQKVGVSNENSSHKAKSKWEP
jgi:hypothetical protein